MSAVTDTEQARTAPRSAAVSAPGSAPVSGSAPAAQSVPTTPGGDRIPVMIPYLDEREAEAARDAVLSGWVAQGPRVARDAAG